MQQVYRYVINTWTSESSQRESRRDLTFPMLGILRCTPEQARQMKTPKEQEPHSGSERERWINKRDIKAQILLFKFDTHLQVGLMFFPLRSRRTDSRVNNRLPTQHRHDTYNDRIRKRYWTLIYTIRIPGKQTFERNNSDSVQKPEWWALKRPEEHQRTLKYG